uniref:Uncharacterized protein n=1 Tax=Amphimedon queenslandica TaxID=400682 RepID=A0A1X7VC83_AMPQE
MSSTFVPYLADMKCRFLMLCSLQKLSTALGSTSLSASLLLPMRTHRRLSGHSFCSVHSVIQAGRVCSVY